MAQPTEQERRELAALRERVREMEREREDERAVIEAATRRRRSRREWREGLRLPAHEHRDGCPASRIEQFDAYNGAPAVVVRCADCGGQVVAEYPSEGG
jgi:hypothetical protein